MEILQQISAIGIVFVLLGTLVWALRRRQGGGPLFPQLLARGLKSNGQQMKVAERLPLTAQHQVHLIEVQGKSLLVVTYPSGAVFHRMDNPAEFRQTFHQVLSEEPHS